MAGAQSPSSAAAEATTSAEVHVDCPELGNEERAAIEARQMSELLSQGALTGTLRLVCSSDRVAGTWEEGGVVLESRFLSRNEGEGAVELLHWLASVLLEMRREREAGSGADVDPSLAPESPGQTWTTGAVAVAASAAPAAPAESVIAPVSPTTSETPPKSKTTASTSSTPAKTPAPEPLTLDASWVYAHFGTEVPGATGPRLGLRLRLLEQVHVGLLVDGKLSIPSSSGPSGGFGVIDFTTGLSATYDFLPFVSATLAPILILSNFLLPSETSGRTGPFAAGGALLLVRAKIPLRDAHPFLELGVQAATPARQATLGGNAVLTVPEWQAQIAVGVEVPL